MFNMPLYVQDPQAVEIQANRFALNYLSTIAAMFISDLVCPVAIIPGCVNLEPYY